MRLKPINNRNPEHHARDWIGHAFRWLGGERGKSKLKPLWKQFDDTHHWDSTAEEWIPNDIASEIDGHLTLRPLFWRRECVLRVHGTNASLDEDYGRAWWQARHDEDHNFWKHVILKLPTPIEADKKVFHWNGGNSECDRQVAAAALLEQLLKLEEVGTRYHLVGHSHGGSVLWAAVCLACERKKKLNGLLSWTTVGTPFLCFRRAKILRLRVLLTAAFATILVLAVGMIARLWDKTSLMKFPMAVYEEWNSGSWFVQLAVMAILAVIGGLWAFPYLRFRRGAYERDAARRYGDKWLAINSVEDEAINFLGSVRPMTGKLAPRWNPAPSTHPNISKVEGFVELRGAKRRLTGQRAPMLLPFLTLTLVLFGVEVRFGIKPPFSGMLFQGGMWLFSLIGTMFAVGIGRTYNRWVVRHLDIFVQRYLTDKAYGNDTRDFRVTHVSSCPPISGRVGACPNLPSTIDIELIRRANNEAVSLVPSVRSNLLYQAGVHTPTLADDQNLPGFRFSGRELVHTSYFDNRDVLRIIHAHIAMQSPLKGKKLDACIVEWIREFKIAVAPHFAQRGSRTIVTEILKARRVAYRLSLF